MKIDICRTCKHAFTTGKDRLYCKKLLADKDDCGEYETTDRDPTLRGGQMKLYVLTVDGYTEPYGSNICLVGVFDSLEKAEEAQKSLDDEIRERASIDEVLLNEDVPLTKDEWGNFHNIHLLGGYCE